MWYMVYAALHPMVIGCTPPGGVQNNNGYHIDILRNLMIQPYVNSAFPMAGYTAFNYDA
jgi:hypothetical protein